jgi:alcohol dehydrogenase, propanol-preferring
MARSMKAAVVRRFKEPLSIDEFPIPEVGNGQILVKIEASGVCHTDLHAADGDWPVKPSPPFIPGHEGVGTVAAVGAGVTAVKEGDRVGVPWLHTACGHCRHCLGSWETLCDSQKNTGYSVNGGFAEYVLADPDYVGHLPDKLDWFTAAPILCAGVTVYKGLKETDTKPGDTVVVSGIGGLGHIAVQYAKAMGRSVIAVDISEEKLALARAMGADAAINAKTTDPVAEVNALCGGAQGVLAKRGTMSLVGLPPGSFELDIFSTVLMRKTIRGSIVGTRLDLAECLQFAGEGKVKVHYSKERLEDINDILDRMRANKIDGRVVMTI